MILTNLRNREDLRIGDSNDVIDGRGLLTLPGFVDLHAHLRQPGFEHKESLASGARAAAAGGFTTVCCLADTEPAIDSLGTLRYVIETALREAVIRVHPIAAITRDRAGSELTDMAELAAAGAIAFSDDPRPVASSRLMRHALEYAASFGRVVIDHCEDADLTHDGAMHEGLVSELLGLPGWPTVAEEIAVARDLALAESTGARLHIAHISTAGSVEAIRQAKRRGVRVTAEVTPQHLALTDEWVARGDYDTCCKVSPPLPDAASQEALIGGLLDGTIDAIATDHSPQALADKACEFEAAAFGMSSLETAFGLLMTLVHDGRLPFDLVAGKLTSGPAGVLGLDLPPDDWTLVDPDAEWTVDAEQLRSRGRNTPLHGLTLRGRVMLTICRGTIVHDALAEAARA